MPPQLLNQQESLKDFLLLPQKETYSTKQKKTQGPLQEVKNSGVFGTKRIEPEL